MSRSVRVLSLIRDADHRRGMTVVRLAAWWASQRRPHRTLAPTIHLDLSMVISFSVLTLPNLACFIAFDWLGMFN